MNTSNLTFIPSGKLLHNLKFLIFLLYYTSVNLLM